MSRRILFVSAALAALAASTHLASERVARAAIPPQPEQLTIELESATEDGVAVGVDATTAQIVRTREGLSFFSAERTEDFRRAQ